MALLELLLLLLAQAACAGAIYGGIRADLRNMREGINDARVRADNAHTRIDHILSRGQA